jgi:hypothetical protein
VTAAWWSQLWLNEGFARFEQFVAGDEISPELQLTDQFISSQCHIGVIIIVGVCIFERCLTLIDDVCACVCVQSLSASR